VKRAVVYCRVSTKEQVSNLSLPVQEKACREWCAREGAEVVQVFVDRGESAKTAARPAFLEALAFCRKGRIDLFVVYSLSRFARSTHDHAVVSHELKSHGTALRSVTEPIDASSSGRLMETILSGFAQFDNDVRAERTRAGMRAALERGRWTHRAPLGYLAGMVPDPDRAPIIREAFALAAEWPGGVEALRRKVGGLGLTSRAGRLVARQTFWAILRNPIYAGILRAPGLEARGAFEPIVDEETFQKVQARMDGRRRPEGVRLRLSPEFPLRGFVRCGPCGHALTGYFARGRHGGRFPYYRCATCNGVSVRRALLEGAFVELLNSAGLSAGELEAMREAVTREAALAQGLAVESRDRKARRLEELRRKKARLMDGYLAGEVQAGAYQEAAAELEALVAAVVAEEAPEPGRLEVERAVAWAAEVLGAPGAAWEAFTAEGKQGFARAAFQEPPAWTPGAGFSNPSFSPIFSSLRDETGPDVGNGGPTRKPREPEPVALPLVFSLWKGSGSPIALPGPVLRPGLSGRQDAPARATGGRS